MTTGGLSAVGCHDIVDYQYPFVLELNLDGFGSRMDDPFIEDAAQT